MPDTDGLKATIDVSIAVARTPRVMQLEGMFDIPPAEKSELSWSVELPLADQRSWHIGLITGPSGSGKTTIARRFFAPFMVDKFDWATDRSVVDGFPNGMGIKDIVALLSAVGFSSPPSWLRPFCVLSTGEQFRVHVARVLAEKSQLAVIDEFTSVVDRTVARIGSAAVAKTVRRRNQRLIAVSCHEDIIEWLAPDWVYWPATNTFAWRSLQRRPPIELEIARVDSSAWRLFARHHYLTANLHRSAVCYCAFIEGRPVAFHSYLPFVGKAAAGSYAPRVRGHRSVCLPDYQGVGIGHALITTLAGMWTALGYRVFRNSGHPAEIAAARRSPEWRCIRQPSLSTRSGGRLVHMGTTRAALRMTASFEYVGPPMDKAVAQKLYARERAA